MAVVLAVSVVVFARRTGDRQATLCFVIVLALSLLNPYAGWRIQVGLPVLSMESRYTHSLHDRTAFPARASQNSPFRATSTARMAAAPDVPLQGAVCDTAPG